MSTQERRLSNRVPFPETCLITPLGGDEDQSTREVKIHDLGAGGLQASCDFCLKVGQELRLTFGEEPGVRMVVKGVVRHCRDDGGDRWLLGIEFQAVLPQDA